MSPRYLCLVTLLMFTACIVVGQLYLTIPLAEDIATFFEIDSTVAAWSGTAFGFAYAVGFLVWGPLSDRIGRRVVLLCGLVGLGLVTALLGLADTFPLFLMGRVLQGFVAASFPPVALSLVGEVLPPKHRPFGVSLISFAFLAAAPVAQFAGVSLPVSPTEFMLMVAPLYLAMAAGLTMILPGGAGNAASGVAVPTEGRFASLLSSPVVLAGWAAALTVLFGFVSFQVGTAMGVGSDVDPQFIRFVGLPPLALSLVAAPVSKRFGPSMTARIGLVISATGLVFAGVGGNATVVAAVFVSGGVALTVPGLIATLAGAAVDHNRGLALALYTFSLFIGASLASPVATALAPAGVVLLYGVPAAFLLAAAIAISVGLRRSQMAALAEAV